MEILRYDAECWLAYIFIEAIIFIDETTNGRNGDTSHIQLLLLHSIIIVAMRIVCILYFWKFNDTAKKEKFIETE